MPPNRWYSFRWPQPVTVIRFSLRCSSKRKIPSSHWGASEVTFRRRASMVLPHSPSRRRSKVAMLHRKNPTVMDRVLPLRTEPSQISPSLSRNSFRFHQSMVSFCRGLKL